MQNGLLYIPKVSLDNRIVLSLEPNVATIFSEMKMLELMGRWQGLVVVCHTLHTYELNASQMENTHACINFMITAASWATTVYRCKFSVHWCKLLCLYYFIMELTIFVLEFACFLSMCLPCCHSCMVVKASFTRVVT